MTIEYDPLDRAIQRVKTAIEDLVNSTDIDSSDKIQALEELIEFTDEKFQAQFEDQDSEEEDSEEETTEDEGEENE